MKTVWTNGAFDVVHRAHLSLLSRARALGDRLIVGLNSDESLARLKPGRPIFSFEDRSLLLLSLRYVDEVIMIEDTPCSVIESVKPDIVVKGRGYSVGNMPEAKIIQEYGGEVVFLPSDESVSTTNVIERIMRVARM